MFGFLLDPICFIPAIICIILSLCFILRKIKIGTVLISILCLILFFLPYINIVIAIFLLWGIVSTLISEGEGD